MVASHSTAQGRWPTMAAGSAYSVIMGPMYIHLHTIGRA